MGFFEDFANGVSGYPAASVTLKINPPTVVTGTTGAINVNEIWKFTVTVFNNGNLNMKSVTLHLTPKDQAKVSSSSIGPWNSSPITTAAIATVPAKGSATTGSYYFLAPPGSTGAPGPLVEAHISGWDANLDYLLNTLAWHAEAPATTFSAQVFP